MQYFKSQILQVTVTCYDYYMSITLWYKDTLIALLVLDFRTQQSRLRLNYKLFYCAHSNFFCTQPKLKITVLFLKNIFHYNTSISDYNRIQDHVIIKSGCFSCMLYSAFTLEPKKKVVDFRCSVKCYCFALSFTQILSTDFCKPANLI